MGKSPFNFLEVDFIHQDATVFEYGRQFDAVITPFFLDCFPTSDLSGAGKRWVNILRDGGKWIFTDFVHGSRWQALIPLMYAFFRITAGLQMQHLPDYSALFRPENFELEQCTPFLSGLVESRVYRKL